MNSLQIREKGCCMGDGESWFAAHLDSNVVSADLLLKFKCSLCQCSDSNTQTPWLLLFLVFFSFAFKWLTEVYFTCFACRYSSGTAKDAARNLTHLFLVKKVKKKGANVRFSLNYP